MDAQCPGRVGLAYQKLTSLPDKVVRHLVGPDCVILDLTHNKIRNFLFMSSLPKLQTLIIDHNGLTSDVVFPVSPQLTTLSANHNNIADLDRFVDMLNKSCPNLTTLSMMYNTAAPNYFTYSSHEQYRDYRYRVISSLPKLRILDDTEVTSEERRTAHYYRRCLQDGGRLKN